MSNSIIKASLEGIAAFLNSNDLETNKNLRGMKLPVKYWEWDEAVYRIGIEHEYVHHFYQLGISNAEEELVTEIQNAISLDGEVYAHGPLKGKTFQEAVELYADYLSTTDPSDYSWVVTDIYRLARRNSG